MKIWPFDQFGPATNGQQISAEEIARGCEPFEKIRRAVGNRIEIALEMHSVWGLPAAQRIARAVEAYDPLWFEDPVRMDNLDALLQFRQSTRIPTTASETMSTRWQFREAFEKGALSVVMFDIGWVGGLSEARKIATMAEAYHMPDRAARLRRPDHADRVRPPRLRRPERLHPGGRARLPPRRLPEPRHRPPEGRERRDPPPGRPRASAPASSPTCARAQTPPSGSPAPIDHALTPAAGRGCGTPSGRRPAPSPRKGRRAVEGSRDELCAAEGVRGGGSLVTPRTRRGCRRPPSLAQRRLGPAQQRVVRHRALSLERRDPRADRHQVPRRVAEVRQPQPVDRLADPLHRDPRRVRRLLRAAGRPARRRRSGTPGRQSEAAAPPPAPPPATPRRRPAARARRCRRRSGPGR